MIDCTDERAEFLSDLLSTAIENYGYAPWFMVRAYLPYLDPKLVPDVQNEKGWAASPREAYAVIQIDDPGDERHGRRYRVDLDTMNDGFRFTESERLRAALDDMEGSDLDVCDALALLQLGLWKEVVYG